MHTKHYLTTILIFATIFLCCFSAKSQNNLDTIRIEKSVIGFDYYNNNNMLNFYQLLNLSKKNEEAHKLMRNAFSFHIASVCFTSAGCFFLGYSAGYVIGCAIKKDLVDMNTFLPFLGAGVGLIGIGIGFELGANNKAKEGVAVYNKSIKQQTNTNLDLGIYPNGMMFRLNF